jgi:hypothetical protein
MGRRQCGRHVRLQGGGETRDSGGHESLSVLVVLGKSPPNAKCSHSRRYDSGINTAKASCERHVRRRAKVDMSIFQSATPYFL